MCLVSSSSYPHGPQTAGFVNCVFHWTISNQFDAKYHGCSDLFFKGNRTFWTLDFLRSIDKLSQCNPSLFPNFLRLPAFFSCKKWWLNLWFHLKTKYFFFRDFFKVTLFWCSTPFTALVVFWRTNLRPKNTLSRRSPCWCRKFVSGLQILETIWFYGDVYKSLSYCINFFQTWLKKNDKIHVFHIFLVILVEWLMWEWTFSSQVKVFGCNFLLLLYYWNVYNCN